MTADDETSALQRHSREISNANLIRFKPGQSGNPAGGIKKEARLTSLLKEQLDIIPPGKDKTWRQLIVEAMLKNALRDPQVLRELLNRCEGKVVDNVDIQGTNVTITYELTKELT